MDGRGADKPPLYARLLRLKHIHPGGWMCALYFEGAIAFAILLSLAELVTWLSVLLLPVTVAGVVKIHDIVAGAFSRSPVIEATRRFTTRKHPGEARGTAVVASPRRPALESPTQLLPQQAPAVGAEPRTRAVRRRATNQRAFTPPTGAEANKNDD